MLSVTVPTGVPYNVQIGVGLLDGVGERIRSLTKAARVMLVTDDIVAPLYGARVRASLESAGFAVSEFVFANGEAQKRLSTLECILEQLAAEHFTRSDLVVALGGGVVGDLAGFAAAVYARGIDYVQVPTTLLAAVDSSVGGKTAVDLAHGKNLCGAFHQPRAVFCDIDTLSTLTPHQVRDGLAEMLKYGVICDEKLFERIQNYKNEDMAALIARCVEIKRDVVAVDEFDRGSRALLNLGHTVGHAVEAASGFAVTHGHAVAAGMGVIARAAEACGFADAGTAARIVAALGALGLPCGTEFDMATLAPLIQGDKKADGTKITLIVPRAVGACSRLRMNMDDAIAFLAEGL